MAFVLFHHQQHDFCFDPTPRKKTTSKYNIHQQLAHLHTPGSHQSSLMNITDGVSEWVTDWQGKAKIGLGSDKNYHDYNMTVKTLMNMIWRQIRYDSENCHDYNLMTKPWWLRYDDCARLGFDPGSRSCHSPSTPSHSLCDQTSANCISSLMLKCICNQHELYLFTHAQVYLCTISSFMIKCILLIHDEVYLCNSASCIFSLMLKCICNQYKP